MRVVINAQLDPQTSGGIAQVLVGLAHGLAQLEGHDEYVFVCSRSSGAWLRPFVGRNQVVEVDGLRGATADGVRESDGFWESFDPDVLHFPYQAYTRTGIPSVFNPHDLQHVHLPEFFTDRERDRRDRLYGEACRDAAAVATAGEWVRNDFIQHFDLPPEKVYVIQWGAPSDAYARPSDDVISETLKHFGLRQPFAIYPAQTWPHKNHKRLFEALSLAIDRHQVDLNLVCPGARTELAESLECDLEALGLQERVHLLGRVSESELMALYASARLMIVPTLFEAISFPVWEAFANNLPVACSNVTSLPEQVGDAALLFDPRDVEQITEMLATLATDQDLRAELTHRGKQRVRRFTWKRTAEEYSRIYRSVASCDQGPQPVSRSKGRGLCEGLTR